VFWWPGFGRSFGHVGLLPAAPAVVIEELVGVAATVWIWSRFGLRDPSRRHELLRRGRLVLIGT
jgi:hypothetical protein